MLISIKRAAAVFLLCILGVFAMETTLLAKLTEASVIGKVESIFNNRVGLKVLHVIKVSDNEDKIATGTLVSFDLPNDLQKGRRNNRINFGTVLEADLMGSTATEYALTTDDSKSGVTQAHSAVLLWTAQSVRMVKNPNDYLPEEERTGRKGRKRNKKKDDEPLRIWTQEETVRGLVHKHKETLYLKEEHVGRKDKGLEIVSEEWLNKIEPYVGNKVVLHGTTHRTSISSGTIEINNLMKIYSK
jgi:hypothetical protein